MNGPRYSILPPAVFEDPQINLTALRVFGLIGSYTDSGGWCFPSQSTIAGRLGVHRTSVNKAIKTLVARGWLESKPRFADNQAQTSNFYRVRIDHENHTPVNPRVHTPCEAQEFTPPVSPRVHTNDPSITTPFNESILEKKIVSCTSYPESIDQAPSPIKAKKKKERVDEIAEVLDASSEMIVVTGSTLYLDVWAEKGYDFNLDVLPTIQAIAEKRKIQSKTPVYNLKFYSDAIHNFHVDRLAEPQKTNPSREPEWIRQDRERYEAARRRAQALDAEDAARKNG